MAPHCLQNKSRCTTKSTQGPLIPDYAQVCSLTSFPKTSSCHILIPEHITHFHTLFLCSCGVLSGTSPTFLWVCLFPFILYNQFRPSLSPNPTLLPPPAPHTPASCVHSSAPAFHTDCNNLESSRKASFLYLWEEMMTPSSLSSHGPKVPV